jgi:hypothetical protein
VGKLVIGGGAGGLLRAGGTLRPGALGFAATGALGLERFSSLELQLEIPNAATRDSTRTVKATRVGVHKGFPVLLLLFDIS